MPLPVGPGDQDHAVGLGDVLAELLQDLVGEAEDVEAQLADGLGDHLLVEDADDRVLAVDAGHDGDAEVDRLVLDLEPEAAVLGDAALGDVEVGHDLDAGDDRRLELLVDGLHGLAEDAVDAELDLDVLVLGLDVDVAGPLLDGGEDDGVDELDDRAVLVGQLLDGDDVLFLAALALDDLGDEALGRVAEDLHGRLALAQGLEDGPLRGGEDLDLLAEEGLDGVDGGDVGGIGDGDLHDAVVLAEGDEREAVDELDGEGLDEVPVEVLGLEVDVGDAVALGQGPDVPLAAAVRPILAHVPRLPARSPGDPDDVEDRYVHRQQHRRPPRVP